MKTYKQLNVVFSAVILSILLLGSCATTKSVYSNLKIEEYDKTHLYQVGANSKDLLIYLEGSGTASVLGEKQNGKWISVNFGYFISKYFGPTYRIAIPEKLFIGIGENHSTDSAFLKKYTVDNLVKSYCKSIDAYLAKHSEYENVYIIGASEGGLLLPKVYAELNQRERIKKAIVIGAGGLDQYECFRILAKSSIEMPEKYRNECKKVDEIVNEINTDPESIEKQYMGWPYLRWNSFFKYRPYEYYSAIKIPVLFYQGRLDWSSPIESVEYLQKNILNTNFEYRYIDTMGHIPAFDDEEMKQFIKELNDWLMK